MRGCEEITLALRGNNATMRDGAQAILTDRASLQADGTDQMGTTTGDTVSQTTDNAGRQIGAGGAPRYTRRLSDKILIAFHHACDQADFEVAEQLLHILEMMLTRRPLTADGTRRRNMESLVAAHERLWHLRNPHREDDSAWRSSAAPARSIA
jgi:hypothetical protein